MSARLWLIASGCVIVAAFAFVVEGKQSSAIREITLRGDELAPPNPDLLQKKLDWFVGQSSSQENLQAIAQTIANHYTLYERPVDIAIPDQSLSSGSLMVDIQESDWSQILIEPGNHFSSLAIRRMISLEPGQPVSGRVLTRQLDWLNRHPNLEVAAEVSEYENGETDLHLKVEDSKPFRLFATYGNNGVDLLGQERIGAGFQWNNVWNRGDQWTFMTILGHDSTKVHGYSSRYVHLLPWKHLVELEGYYVETALRQRFLNSRIEGTSWGVGVNYRIPLPGTEGFSHEMVIGMDYKQSDNDLAFGNLLTFSDTMIIQARIGYEAMLRDRWGATRGSAVWTISPGNLTGSNSDEAFGGSHPDADSNYHYVRLSLERVQRLPWDLTMVAKGGAQWSSERLLPTEQVSLGGANSVRGFDEHTFLGDWGAWGSVEVRSPELSVRQCSFQGIAFTDAGVTGLRGVHDRNRLVSAGLGLRFQVADHLSGFVDYGWGVNRSGSEVHFGLRAQY